MSAAIATGSIKIATMLLEYGAEVNDITLLVKEKGDSDEEEGEESAEVVEEAEKKTIIIMGQMKRMVRKLTMQMRMWK